MKVPDPKLADEQGRIAALRRYEVLDTPDEIAFDRITGLVKSVMAVPMCGIALIDVNRQWQKSCIGLPDRETPREITFCTHTIQQREPLVIADAHLDARFAANPLVTGAPHIRSYVGVPLSTPDGYNVGSLCAIDTVPRNFSFEQIEVLKSFAALVVDELELRLVAQTDFLTGAVTRRALTLELEKTVARFERANTPAALVMLDVDRFKAVNDTYGHAAGDRVLKAIARELNNQLRVSDTLGRLGGEEFGVLLQDTQLEGAAQVAERVRAAIEAMSVEHDPVLKVTASFGVCALDTEIRSADQWLAAADHALYESKRGGRNRCSVAPTVAAALR